MIQSGLLIPALPRFLLLLLALVALTACGVEFKEEYPDTEVFKGIELSGERLTNAPLTVTVTVSLGYPVPVRIACLYERKGVLRPDLRRLTFEERATRIGEVVLSPATTEDGPQGQAPTQRLSFPFSVAEAGDYFLACLTPAAADNGLGINFRIEAGPTSS